LQASAVMAGDTATPNEAPSDFLGNVAEMVRGNLNDLTDEESLHTDLEHGEGTGRQTSTLRAEQKGCVVIRIQKEAFNVFLDAHPALLLD